MERLLYADSQVIDSDLLRRYLHQEIAASYAEENDPILNRFFQDQKHQLAWLRQVLNVLRPTCRTRMGMGRGSIQHSLEERNIYRSEQEIRTALNTLHLYQLVQVLRGRGGTRLTLLGIKALEQMENLERSVLAQEKGCRI